MPGKRRRAEGEALGLTPASTTTQGKPLSAIAAARLRAEAAASSDTGLEPTEEPVSVSEPVNPLPQSPAVLEHEDSELDEEHLPVRQNVKLCTWRKETQNVLSDTDQELTVNLDKHTTIALIGCFRFKVLRGAVNVNGANIGAVSRDGQQDQVYTAHVPATHPISRFRGLDGVNYVQFLHCEDYIPLEKTGPLFANIWNIRTGQKGSRSFNVITESGADVLARPLTPEACPEDWLRAVEDCAADPSIVVAVGASVTGKSTFARRLLNRYLTGQGKSARSLPAVCYLDLDSSKPEYTPHGQISLVVVRSLNLGPSFTHPATLLSPPGPMSNETIRSHSMPANSANYRDYYRACIEHLFLAYREFLSQQPLLPLIINMPGTLYTSDFELVLTLLARFKPHHAVHLGDTRAIDTEQATKLHSLQTIVSQYRGTVHEITAQYPTTSPLRTDLELRAMHMQSYFHLNNIGLQWPSWNSSPMSGLTPWEYCYDGTDDRMQDFVGFAMYTEPMESSSLLHSLNGSIVQILESTSSVIPTPYTTLPRTPRHRVPHFAKSDHTGMVDPLEPQTSKLICAALVRGIDLERRIVQILVPKSHEALLHSLLPERTILVGGCCDSPEWAYLEHAHVTNEWKGRHRSFNGSTGYMPWVADMMGVDEMGYLNTLRRVRKFQT